MNRDDMQARQSPVQRKMLNPNSFRHPDSGRIWTMVEYWTIQPLALHGMRSGERRIRAALSKQLSVRQVEFPQERGVSRIAKQALHEGVDFHSAQSATT